MGAAAPEAAQILGESIGFWIQTGAVFLSAIAAVYIIYHNGKLAKKRALIDLIIQQKSDEKLMDAIHEVYALSKAGNHLSQMVDGDKEQTILRVLNNQEFIAVGIRTGAFDEGVYKQLQCSNVLKLWTATSGFIQEIRKIDGKNTLFQDFERLANKWEKRPIKKL
jgi:hypothetical protein